MTVTEETKVPAELLDEYAPEHVRQTWATLAATVEQRKAELVDLIQDLQAAYAAQAVAPGG